MYSQRMQSALLKTVPGFRKVAFVFKKEIVSLQLLKYTEYSLDFSCEGTE